MLAGSPMLEPRIADQRLGQERIFGVQNKRNLGAY